MRHSVHHNLDRATARRVTDEAWKSYRVKLAKYHPSFQWQGERRGAFAFQAKGLSLQGALELEEGAITVEMKVPFLLRVFERQATQVFERELRTWVDAANRGEL